MSKSNHGMKGVIAGSIALILALVHFWAGPFNPEPTFESVLSDAAESIKQTTKRLVDGEPVASKADLSDLNIDKIIQIVVAVLGGIAVILAAFSFSNHESQRAAISAAALGVGAIAFQFIAANAMA